MPVREFALKQIQHEDGLPSGDLSLERGFLAFDQERFDDAIGFLSQAKQSQPRSIEIGNALASALRASGQKEEGDREAQRIATAQSELLRSDRLQQELSGHPDDFELRLEIGTILLRDGDPSRGKAWVQSVINLFPGHRRANLLLAEYYESLAESSPRYAEFAEQYRARVQEAEQTPQ